MFSVFDWRFRSSRRSCSGQLWPRVDWTNCLLSRNQKLCRVGQPRVQVLAQSLLNLLSETGPIISYLNTKLETLLRSGLDPTGGNSCTASAQCACTDKADKSLTQSCEVKETCIFPRGQSSGFFAAWWEDTIVEEIKPFGLFYSRRLLKLWLCSSTNRTNESLCLYFLS